MSTEIAPILELAKRDSKRRRELVEAEVNKIGRRGVEIGATGLEVFGGIISGNLVEHNNDWLDQQRYTTVDLMRRGDATVAATLASITLPILATEAHVVAKTGSGDDAADPEVEKVADFINDQLFGGGMDQSWETFLRECLLHQAYGHYLFEKVFKIIEGGEHSGMVGWKKFAPRHPSTIERWFFDIHGEPRAVEQSVYSEAAPENMPVTIPTSKLLTFTHQEEAGNVLGVSVLRPAYKHWRYKDGFYAVQAIAIERQGAGVPYAQYPQGTPDGELDATEEMLQNIQAHEQSYFMYGEDWEVGFTNMGAQSVLNPSGAIEHHDAMIPKSVLAGFLNLPQDGKGSYALSEDSSGFFNFSLQTGANYIADVITRQAIREITDLNWPGLNQYPKLRFDRVGHLGMGQVLEAIEKSVKAEVLTPDIGLENRVRDYLNLPAVDEEDFEEFREPDEPPMPPGGMPPQVNAPAKPKAIESKPKE